MSEKHNTLQQIIFNIEHIGTPHPVCMKLIKRCEDVDIKIEEIATDIGNDATVSALILKTANSVHFSRGQRFKTIKQAVMHLGINNIRKLLFAVEMLGIFRANCHCSLFSETDFWKHTLAGAFLASKYAGLKKSCNPEVSYVTALIRNIGVLAVRQFSPYEFNQILKLRDTKNCAFNDLVRTVLGTSQKEIGYMVGLRWNLPGAIIDSIKDTTNPYELNDEIRAIRESLLFADDLLHVTNYCVWDKNYLPGNIDFHGIPSKEMFEETIILVEKMIEEFWR